MASCCASFCLSSRLSPHSKIGFDAAIAAFMAATFSFTKSNVFKESVLEMMDESTSSSYMCSGVFALWLLHAKNIVAIIKVNRNPSFVLCISICKLIILFGKPHLNYYQKNC